MEKKTVYNVERVDGKEITQSDKDNFKDWKRADWDKAAPMCYGCTPNVLFVGDTEYKIGKELIEVEPPKIFWCNDDGTIKK